MRKQILGILLSSLLCVVSGCGIVVTQSPQEIEQTYDAIKEKVEDGELLNRLLQPNIPNFLRILQKVTSIKLMSMRHCFEK